MVTNVTDKYLKMKIHILGICGTFMGGLAQILVEKGHAVSGSDKQFYPPMSDQLDSLGVDMVMGYEESDLPDADLYVIGNALSRGNPSVEYILNQKLDYTSGPKILGEIIQDKTVIAVSGTHGKTSTSFLICEKCDNVTELIGNNLFSYFSKQADKNNFKYNKHCLEIFGLCENCKLKN